MPDTETVYTRALYDGANGVERLWVEVHPDGTLTTANEASDGNLPWGSTITIEGETDTTWGKVVA